MPVCSFFLRGVCTKDNCPYVHVSVGKDAEVCQDFLRGYCPSGEQVCDVVLSYMDCIGARMVDQAIAGLSSYLADLPNLVLSVFVLCVFSFLD